jgi:hypothetical protein
MIKQREKIEAFEDSHWEMCIIPHDGDFDFSDSEIKAETGERRVPDLYIKASYVALPGAKSAPKFHTQVCNIIMGADWYSFYIRSGADSAPICKLSKNIYLWVATPTCTGLQNYFKIVSFWVQNPHPVQVYKLASYVIVTRQPYSSTHYWNSNMSDDDAMELDLTCDVVQVKKSCIVSSTRAGYLFTLWVLHGLFIG